MDKKIDVLKEIIFSERKVVAVPSGNENNDVLAMTAIKNLSDYGFIIDGKGAASLKTASKEDIAEWYYAVSGKFNELAGGDHTYKPFYPDFPEQVMELSDFELFIDQISHYISVFISKVTDDEGFIYMPEGENHKEGIKSLEKHPLKVVSTVCGDDEIMKMASEIFKNTLKSKATPAPHVVQNVINAYINAIPNWTDGKFTITNRMTLCYIYAIALMQGKDTLNFPKLVTNDYLRIVQMYTWMKQNNQTSMSDLNIIIHTGSMSGQQRIASFPNYLRRFIADGLNKQKNLEEDIARNKTQWKVMFKLMHVGTMHNLERLHTAANKLRNNEPLNTFYHRVEKAFSSKRYNYAVELLASRPGEFIKSFNRLLMVEINDTECMKNYVDCLIASARNAFAKTRPEDLVKFIGYLKSRTREDRLPVHFVKGQIVQPEKKYEVIPKATADFFTSLAEIEIMQQIKTGKPYGKVYIDPALKKSPLPSETSDMDGSMNSYSRGTRIPVEKTEDGKPKNMRMFVWWTNRKDHTCVDLDLSANFYKENDGKIEYMDSVAYHSHYNEGDGAIVHSGDITNGGSYKGDGVTEYIDINMEKVKMLGIDYIEVYINSYSGGPFKNIPCLGGWQEREELDKSQQFDIKAVKQTSQLNRNVQGVVMAILDVRAAEIIWMDLPAYHAVCCSNSMDTISQFGALIDRYAKGDQMTMADMVNLAIDADGGEIVDTIEEADVIFSFDAVSDVKENQELITAKDLDIWAGRFMSPYEAEDEKEDAVVSEEQENDAPMSAMHAIAADVGLNI